MSGQNLEQILYYMPAKSLLQIRIVKVGGLVVLKNQNALIGNSGYKGPPRNNAVEIEYEGSSSLRGMELATEIAAALVDHTITFPEVTHVLTHTIAEENESCNVLRKCGFHFV